ncbi:hypothetical protein IGJ16_001943 [Enterococcus pernyi]
MFSAVKCDKLLRRWEIMSKKNKDIEVRTEEIKKTIKGNTYEVTQLFIGKKMIGEILAYGPKEFEIFLGEEDFGKEKSLENAIETVIRHWNLHE